MRIERVLFAGLIIIICGVLFGAFTITGIVSSVNVTPIGVLDNCDIGSGNKTIRVRGIFTESDSRLKDYRNVCEKRIGCAWTDLGKLGHDKESLDLYACCSNDKNTSDDPLCTVPRRCQLKFENN